MHDFQHATAEAAMDLLNELKAAGYKVVFMEIFSSVQERHNIGTKGALMKLFRACSAVIQPLIFRRLF